MTAIDRFLPVYQFNERHQTTIRATPAAVDRAIRHVTMAEMPFVDVLFWLRALPARVLGSRFRQRSGAPPEPAIAPARPILDSAIEGGFTMLHDAPGRDMVLGTIGRFWQASGGSVHLKDPAQFGAFEDPTYGRAVMDFRIELAAGGQVRLMTETRIHVPDPVARRRFRWYWFAVYPGSALIRVVWLRAIKRRAERTG